LNLRDNFHFNALWLGRNVAVRIIYMRLAESDITVTPSFTCMD